MRHVYECVWWVVGWFWKSVHDHHQRGEEEVEEGVWERGRGLCNRERCSLRVAMVIQENPTLGCCF